MYCGSCLNDNTLARAISELGFDIQLVPTYTPITTDESDFSLNQVFFGGINVYLQQKFPPLRWLPSIFDRVLNSPALIRWATKKDVQTDPAMLGAMTVSMLKARDGYQKKEVARLMSYLGEVGPDLVNFTNVLIAGCVRELKSRWPKMTTVVTLQGDDIFLDYIPEKYRRQSIEQIKELSEFIDGYVAHSLYYADYMSDRLEIPRSKIHVVKLGIDHEDFQKAEFGNREKRRIGYLARLTPEKGLHVLVDAFLKLREKRDDVELALAGWVGSEHATFAEQQFEKLANAGLENDYVYKGVVDRSEKVAFLRDLDVFSVPTTYREPKGRFALEAMAAGIPLVLPDHGAFPELIKEAGCGVLVPPNEHEPLAVALDEMLNDQQRALELGSAGRETIIESRSAKSMARETIGLYERLSDGSA